MNKENSEPAKARYGFAARDLRRAPIDMKQIIAIFIAGSLAGCASMNQSPLVGRFAETDSVVVLRLDSRKPAKVEIFHCTVEKTLRGPKPPVSITLSFLHFPGCQRLTVGTVYLCAIRRDSGTIYTLIRSDMLIPGDKKNLYNCAWEADGPAAREMEEQIRRHNKASEATSEPAAAAGSSSPQG